MADGPPVPGRDVYAEFIKEQLEAEDERKTSFEQRAMAVITTSGALVTLLFALAGLAKGTRSFVLTAEARPLLLGALGLFVLAGAMAIVTNAPLRYHGVQADDLQLAVREWWEDSAAVARQRVAATQVHLLREAKRLNSWKGAALVVAMLAQLLAVLFVALAIATILRRA